MRVRREQQPPRGPGLSLHRPGALTPRTALGPARPAGDRYRFASGLPLLAGRGRLELRLPGAAHDRPA